MNAIATQKGARMVRRGMSDLGVGITPPPSQDGGAIDNEVTGADQSTTNGNLHGQDEQCLAYRGSSSLLTLPLLGS